MKTFFQSVLKRNLANVTTRRFSCTTTPRSSVDHVKQLHAVTIKTADNSLKNYVLFSYATLGQNEITKQLVLETNFTEEYDLTTWESVIKVYGQQGRAVEALNVFRQLRRAKIPLNKEVWSTTLEVCHKRPIAQKKFEVKSLFKDLVNNDPSNLDASHILTMFSTLNASNELNRALELFEFANGEILKSTSAIKLTTAVLDDLWVKFATQCEKHEKFDLASKAFSYVKHKTDDVKNRLKEANERGQGEDEEDKAEHDEKLGAEKGYTKGGEKIKGKIGEETKFENMGKRQIINIVLDKHEIEGVERSLKK